MIKIHYDSEKAHIFDLNYKIHECIPKAVFEKYPENTELHFIQGLFAFNSYIKFIGTSPAIWSTHYLYKYMDKGFKLVYDEDYDLIHYAVENPRDRNEIAEYICKLISEAKNIV